MNDHFELRKYAANQLSLCNVVYIASVDAEGYPRICPVTPLKTEGYGAIWFISACASEKIRCFRLNPKASVCYGEGDERQILVGRVTVMEDAATKRALWRDSLTAWFPGGADDPGLCAVRFTAERATLWYGGVTETFFCCS